jgi:hypothetical protein
MSRLVWDESRLRPLGNGRAHSRVRSALLLVALALLPPACGKSSADDDGGDAGSAGSGGSSGSAAGAASGGKAGGTAGEGGGKAGSSGKGGQAGRGGSSGSGGSAGSATGGSDAAGGAEDAGTGGDASGNGGVTSGGSAGTAGTAGNAGTGGAIELPEELSLLVSAFCATARTCCEAAGEPPGALVACEDVAAGRVSTFGMVIDGTVTLNMNALTACIDAYEAAEESCAMAGVEAACHGVFEGTRADGEPCSDAFECDRSAGPKICEIIQEGNTEPYVGSCVDPPRGTSGTPCAASCEIGANCSTTSISSQGGFPSALCWEEDGLFCPLGEACASIVEDGIECSYDQACGSDGICQGSCETLLEVGADCSFGPACASSVCENAKCVVKPFANYDTCIGHMPDMD